jgi:molybdate transport system ATP-binding protein
VTGDVVGSGLCFDGSVRRGAFELQAQFGVSETEVLGVIGPNGAGKSTLLRSLAGLTALTSGRITLGGDVFDDASSAVFRPAEDRPVGLVFQNYRLFPHLTVRDNVAFAGRAHGRSKRVARGHADSWLARLQLTELAERKPGQLSGGQAQRVALARALAAEPGLLLLDEPLSALDARTRVEVRSELSQHLAEFPGPALVVTHDPLEALIMADRLLVIEDGRVVQEAPPAEVATKPATQYVARLVGLNLYRGVLEPRHEIALEPGGRLIAAEIDASCRVGDQVLVALLPSAIAVHTSPPQNASPRNVWRGQVGGLELLGDRVRVQVQGEPAALVDLTPASLAELSLTTGSPVWLSAKATEVSCYPDAGR